MGFMQKYKNITQPAKSSRHFKYNEDVGKALNNSNIWGKFNDDYRVWTFPNGCEVITYLHEDKMTGAGYIAINVIGVAPTCKRQGLSSKVLKEIVKLADQSGVGLTIVIGGDEGFLYKWYKSYGFEDSKAETMGTFAQDPFDLIKHPKGFTGEWYPVMAQSGERIEGDEELMELTKRTISKGKEVSRIAQALEKVWFK